MKTTLRKMVEIYGKNRVRTAKLLISFRAMHVQNLALWCVRDFSLVARQIIAIIGRVVFARILSPKPIAGLGVAISSSWSFRAAFGGVEPVLRFIIFALPASNHARYRLSGPSHLVHALALVASYHLTPLFGSCAAHRGAVCLVGSAV